MWFIVGLIAALTVAGAALSLNAVIKPNSELLAELGELTATGNLWDGAKLHLYKVQTPLSPTMVLADFTVADFTGYATSTTIVWGTPFLSPSGVPTVDGDAKTFIAGSPLTTPNTVYGWFITDSAGTVLLFARQFDAPINVSAAGVGFSVLPAVPAYLTQ